ncbi:hypothetical protein [Nocardia cyriacigeorgica]|uniref:hypothetical protein n=1 Tax=Nocardia cyriacigeorgica TaxID=135487 RepID=UPI002457C91C|nr:hypothetical protein [Nocardia cyriacigeorgica]
MDNEQIAAGEDVLGTVGEMVQARGHDGRDLELLHFHQQPGQDIGVGFDDGARHRVPTPGREGASFHLEARTALRAA